MDNWEHRSEMMRCQTCMWYVGERYKGKDPMDQRYRLGRCRRHAPTMSGYPAVWPTDWCGDHKLEKGTRLLPDP